jgi:hypothetical protein
VRRSRWSTLVSELRSAPDGTPLLEFLNRHGHRLEDIYRRGSWTGLRREARCVTPVPIDAVLETRTLKALRRMTHVDDPERVAFYRALVTADAEPRQTRVDERKRRLLTMLAWGLNSRSSGHESLPEYLAAVCREPAVRSELRSRTAAAASVLPPEIPLTIHARYSRQEIVAALGYASGLKPKTTQGGILWVPQSQSDVFFVDLHKTERDYSPTTMYRDYAINRELFHWESQSRQTPSQPTVQRYINHRARGTRVLLFVRERKRFELGTQPFTFLGPVEYVTHRGERPVAFTWRLPVPMPEEIFEIARSVSAA